MHNIILILVSSKWLIPSSGVRSWYQILGSKLFIFSFRSSKLFQLYHFKPSSNHCKASPCVVNFSFFLSSFYYRSSSWRLYMVVRQGFFSFFNCSSRFLSKLWSAKLYSKINMVPNTCFVLMRSSILLLAFRSAILSTLSFEMVLYHSWQFPSCFMIHMLSRMRYCESIIFSSIMNCFNPY